MMLHRSSTCHYLSHSRLRNGSRPKVSPPQITAGHDFCTQPASGNGTPGPVLGLKVGTRSTVLNAAAVCGVVKETILSRPLNLILCDFHFANVNKASMHLEVAAGETKGLPRQRT